MLTLVKAQIWKYKSIEDSTPVALAEDVTVLVGKNESGKTAFLEPLHKALPLGGAKYDYVADYPRKDLVRYRLQHEAKNYQTVVQLTFRIEKELADKINAEVFGGPQIVAVGSTITRATTVANTANIGYQPEENAALTPRKSLTCERSRTDEVFADAISIADVLTKIEGLSLTADSTLAVFAALWRGPAIKPDGCGLIEGHIWQTYLSPALPKFLYSSD